MIWYWNNTPYSLAQIAQGDFVSDDHALQTAWGFAQAWLAGKDVFVLPTSGSTGEPKPITITRKQMQASAKGTAQALDLASCQTALLAIHAQYVGGKMMLVRALEYGLRLTGIPAVSNPLAYLADLYGKENLPTFDFIALVPAQLYTIATETPDLLACFSGSKAIILGGGAVGEALERVIQDLDVPIYNTYGMTETVSHIALKRLNGAEKTDYFLAFEGVQLGVDERDCLRICAEVTQNEWVQTHDVVQLLDNQRFVWLGRADNTLNSGGVKIQIETLEAKIEPLLRAEEIHVPFAIVGLPDDKWQQKIVLYLETPALPAETVGKLDLAFRTHLQRHEVPKEIRCLASFPRTETGKILRGAFLQS